MRKGIIPGHIAFQIVIPRVARARIRTNLHGNAYRGEFTIKVAVPFHHERLKFGSNSHFFRTACFPGPSILKKRDTCQQRRYRGQGYHPKQNERSCPVCLRDCGFEWLLGERLQILSLASQSARREGQKSPFQSMQSVPRMCGNKHLPLSIRTRSTIPVVRKTWQSPFYKAFLPPDKWNATLTRFELRQPNVLTGARRMPTTCCLFSLSYSDFPSSPSTSVE